MLNIGGFLSNCVQRVLTLQLWSGVWHVLMSAEANFIAVFCDSRIFGAACFL